MEKFLNKHLDDLSIRNKVIFTIFAIISSIIVLNSYFYIYFYDKHMHLHLIEKNNQIASLYKKTIQNQEIKYNFIIKEILSNEKFIEAFREKDRLKAFNILKEKFNYLQKQDQYLKVLHLHFSSGETFLRVHKKDEFGDNLLEKRAIIKQAIIEQKPTSGFEVGINGVFFRIMQPAYSNGVFLGVVEIGIEIENFSNEIKAIENIKQVILVDEEHLKTLKNNPTAEKLWNFRVFGGDKKFVQILRNRNFVDDGTCFNFKAGQEDYLVNTSLDMVGAKNDKIGKILIFFNISKDEKYKENILIFTILSLGAGLLIVIFVLFKGFNFILNDIKNLNEKLIELNSQLKNKITDKNIENTKLKESQVQLSKQVLTDPLTNIFNRRMFQESLLEEIAKTSFFGTDLSLIVFDIDFFKKINDRFGHLAGDEVLKEIASRVGSLVRQSDKFCRIGGEEFALIAPFNDLKNALFLAEKIRFEIEKTNFEGIGKVTISLGVAQYCENENSTEFYERADKALYAAKNSGRNMVCEG